MEKSKIFFFLCAVLVLTSCGGSNDDPVLNDTSAIYRVTFEASGEDYTAEATIIDLDNGSIVDETNNLDLKQNSVNEYFKGVKIYRTSKKTKFISVRGIILSKLGASLKMTVYRDGKEIYQNTVAVPDSGNTTKTIIYSNISE